MYALLSNAYPKVNTDACLTHKLNNNTGSLSMSIKNNSGVDVIVFHNTKNVELKGDCYTYGKLSVLNTTTLGNTLTVAVAASGGGSIKVVAFISGNEASVGFDIYTDMRCVVAGDVWVVGVSCWERWVTLLQLQY